MFAAMPWSGLKYWSSLGLLMAVAVFHHASAIIPLTQAASAKITQWMGTPQAKLKQYMNLDGYNAEVRTSDKLVGFRKTVKLHSFVFNSPNLDFTAEYITDGDARTRSDYPAALGRATRLTIVGTVTFGGSDKTDLESEFDSSSRHLKKVEVDGTQITSATVGYQQLLHYTIGELEKDLKNKMKILAFGAKKSDLELMPLAPDAAAKIEKWLTTPQGKMTKYVGPPGATAEVTKSDNLVGFQKNVGLHSFAFAAPAYLGFTAEYVAEGGPAARSVYPAALGGATRMKIKGIAMFGGNDKNDLETEFDSSRHHLSSIELSDGTQITKQGHDDSKYDRLLGDTIPKLRRDLRNKIKMAAFEAKEFDLH